MTVLSRIKSAVANSLAVLLHHSSFRYGTVLPLMRELMPDPDERMLSLALEFVAHNNPGGDYLEFGVWKGRSFIKAFHIWKYISRRTDTLREMRFFAFDSFQGLPEITTAEDRSTGEFKKGDYTFTEDQFRRTLKSRHIDMDRVRIVHGWYNHSLNEKTKRELSISRASIVFIDCDLYESAVPVLEFITDYIVDGTVIIFDDWYCFGARPDRGEQKAFAEWLQRNPAIKSVPWHSVSWKSQSFILYRA